MSQTNKFQFPKTHEGAKARKIGAYDQLRRSVMSCLLFEDSFYENGVDIATRIAEGVANVHPKDAAAIAIQARNEMNLRHAPLLIAREMARLEDHRGEVRFLLPEIIRRADELAEFLAIYWKDGRQPLSAQVKKGLAAAFVKFDAYQLAKYNRDNPVKLRDVLFLCHAKPKDDEQAEVWKALVNGTLQPPDTWEVALSGGADKCETWERLLSERKLGALALLRNLRNMQEVGVDENLIVNSLLEAKTERVLPFRFIAASRYAETTNLKDALEKTMFRSLEGHQMLYGKTILLIDVSGSMEDKLSEKSDMTRMDAACGLAIIAEEICENVEIFTFSQHLVEVDGGRGFELARNIEESQDHAATYLGSAVRRIDARNEEYDRLIVFTDEQSHDPVPDPKGKGYMVNIASYRNGVGYGGNWNHVDGFSEAIVDYIVACEKQESE